MQSKNLAKGMDILQCLGWQLLEIESDKDLHG